MNLFQQFDKEQPEFMLAVIPEAILCTREVGERARTAAYTLLVQMCKSQIEHSDESPLGNIINQNLCADVYIVL